MMHFHILLLQLLVAGSVLVCLAQDSRTVSRNSNRNRNRNRNMNRNRDRTGNNDGPGDDFDANVLLEKFGYLDDSPNHMHSEDQIANAMTEYQRFNGLNVTGILDESTLWKLQQPRCGIPDVIKPGQRPLEMRVDGATAPLAFHAPGYKWQTNRVTYNVERFTRQLNTNLQSRAFYDAFRKWSAVTPLTFQRTNGPADIMIKFAAREHGDGPGNAFDGRSGTLAHAFFPGEAPVSGDTHFDDDELWTLREDRGSNLEIVAAHEFGHALGMGHSSTPQALMAPYYQGYDPNYSLHRDDIRGIQQLYGGPRREPATRRPVTQRPVTRRPATRRPATRRPATRRPATRRPVTRRPATRRPATQRPPTTCNLRFDSIEQIHNGQIMAFKGRDVYVITRNGPVNRTRTRSLFRRAPSSPSAVVYDRYGRYLYMFKGSRYWKYRGFDLQSGYPRTLPTDFHRIKAAMQWRDGGIYLFKGRNYIRWAEGLRSYPSGYPRRAREYWRSFPSNPDAAFRSYDGYYYVFKHFRYWRFNSRASMSPGYPKNTRPVWLNCGRRTSRMQAQSMSATNLFSFLTTEFNNAITED